MEKREKDSVTADGWGLLKMERYYLKKERRVFMVEQYFKNNEGFSNKIIFGDKIHFHDGLVIGRNCRIGDSENPRVIVEK